MACKRKSFERNILTVGEMRNFVHIQQRAIQNTGYNDSQPTEKFIDIWQTFSKLVDLKDVSRFAGVVIDQSMTHACYIPYYAKIYELDINTLFLKKSGTFYAKDKLYKLKTIRNYGEQDEYMILFLEERGFTENTAVQA
jgi:hypothetical protein